MKKMLEVFIHNPITGEDESLFGISVKDALMRSHIPTDALKDVRVWWVDEAM